MSTYREHAHALVRGTPAREVMAELSGRAGGMSGGMGGSMHMFDGLAMRERVDSGIAVDTPDGLVAPVLPDVAQRSMEALAAD